MSLAYHRLPAAAFDELASGGGTEAIGLLRRSQESKHALLLRGIGEHAPAAYDLLARAQHKDSDAVSTIVRYPSVGAWAYRTMRALRGGPPCPGASPPGLWNVAVAAAIRARLPAEAAVPAADGQVVLPSLGVADVPGTGTTTVRVTTAGVQIRTDSGHITIPAAFWEAADGWRPLRPLLPATGEAAGIVLDEIDPFRMPAAPDAGTATDLDSWRSVFASALALLRLHHPAVATEVAAIVSAVVPLAAPPNGQVSSSSAEAFGAVAMSEPVDERTLALTLAHEIQHLKLSAVLDMVTLSRPDDGSRYYAPWRDDPRPAIGLLHGTYAYLGVTAFWRRQRSAGTADSVADTEFARWRDSAALGCATLLASGQLTEDGERFVRTMAETLLRWQGEPVPEAARQLAHERNALHRTRWEGQYGGAQQSSPGASAS
jgi:HEXXH motif-containing protein